MYTHSPQEEAHAEIVKQFSFGEKLKLLKSAIEDNNRFIVQKLTFNMYYKFCAKNRGLFDIAFVLVAVFFYIIADTDLSSTLTISAFFEVLALLPVAYSNSLSSWTLKMLGIVLFIRNVLITTYRGHQPYIPTDESGRYLFPTFKALSLVLVFFAHQNTTRKTLKEECPFGEWRSTAILLAIGVCCSYPCYADLVEFATGDRMFTVCTILETFAYIPQMRRVSKYDYSREDSPFLFHLVLSNSVQFVFWYLAYSELETYMFNKHITGPLFLACWITQFGLSLGMLTIHCLSRYFKRSGILYSSCPSTKRAKWEDAQIEDDVDQYC